MSFRLGFIVCAGVAGSIAHFLSGAHPVSTAPGPYSTLYAVPGIAALVLLAIGAKHPNSAEGAGSLGPPKTPGAAVGRCPGPIAIGNGTVGWSMTGRYRTDGTHRSAEGAERLQWRCPATEAIAGGGGLVRTLQNAVDLIPRALRYPQIAHARIICAGMIFHTAGFIETGSMASSLIVVDGEPVGSVQVFYEAGVPGAERGRFLESEVYLIRVLAAYVGEFIECHQGSKPARRQRWW
jgi:hypothetical protein